MPTRLLSHLRGHRLLERGTAVASFAAAVALAFTAVAISPQHDVAAGVAMVIAQFLLLTASIFGIDYKLNNYGQSTSITPRAAQQQPA